MKNILISISILFLIISNSTAQLNPTERYVSTEDHIQSNIERYKIDYELVDESKLDSERTILLSLNLDLIEIQRAEDEDQIFEDPTTQIQLLVYSYQKVAIRKRSISNGLNQSK